MGYVIKPSPFSKRAAAMPVSSDDIPWQRRKFDRFPCVVSGQAFASTVTGEQCHYGGCLHILIYNQKPWEWHHTRIHWEHLLPEN